jgi:hypothetical protein
LFYHQSSSATKEVVIVVAFVVFNYMNF